MGTGHSFNNFSALQNMSSSENSNATLLLKVMPFLCYTLLGLYCINNFFFQDMVQLSSWHGSWFYDNEFKYFFYPNDIDSGHPPLNGILLAGWWSLLGKTLWASHLLTLVFSLILIYQVQKLCDHFFAHELAPLVSLVLLLDPTLLSQSVIVSPDIILMSAFFLSVRAIYERRSWMLAIGIIFLSLISTRGMLCTATIYFWGLYINWSEADGRPDLKKLFRYTLPFVPGVLLAFAFLIAHYIAVGWVGHHDNMPWAPSFEKVDLKGALKNVVVVVWRFIDFGRFIFALLLIYLVWVLRHKKLHFSKKEKGLFVLFGLLLLSSSYSALLHKLLAGHRYFLPHFIIFALIVMILLRRKLKATAFKMAAYGIGLVLLCGNLIRYPESISVGWDASLAHLPFYSLRNEMIRYMEDRQIDFNDVASEFGIDGDQHSIDLRAPRNRFISKNWQEKKYFIYTNISNLPDEQRIAIRDTSEFISVHKLTQGAVVVELLERR